MRAVLDTNVWLRGILSASSASGQVIAALVDGRFALVTSEPLLEEVADVLARPELRRKYKKLTPENVARVLDLQRLQGDVVAIPGTLRLCRDPKDDKFIETALHGRAEVIVSYDDDLLTTPIPGIQIVRADLFLRLLNTPP
jgi:putative PIN family toxin of toxin-antitoxin system